MRFIRDAAYTASMELAIEKGSFPKFEPSQYGKASFIRKLPASLRTGIKKYGTRNCSLMALAPTGTISLLTGYMSAIEPLFAKAYLRKDRVGERMYIHPKYQELLQTGEQTPEWFVDAFDLQPKDHFEIQVACQKYCDASVSKTINLPENMTTEDLRDLLLEYMYDLKGVTVYRDGCRPEQILNRVPEEEVIKYLKENNIENNLESKDVSCATGACEI
jgi:ribonucleoside-diphosphate reductase alpha chain